MLVCSRALEWLENTRSSIVSAREREAHAMLAFVCWQFVGAESFEPCPNALSREQKLRTSCRNALLQTRAVGRGVQPPLDFKIWHFPIKFLATKVHFLSFERVKWNFKENPLFPPPGKYPSDAHDCGGDQKLQYRPVLPTSKAPTRSLPNSRPRWQSQRLRHWDCGEARMFALRNTGSCMKHFCARLRQCCFVLVALFLAWLDTVTCLKKVAVYPEIFSFMLIFAN